MSTRKAVSRPTLLVVALAALALCLYFAVRPAYAGGVATLQESQKGTDSSQATDDCSDNVDVPAGEVLWHFILNGLDPGITSPISGHFEFDSAGTLNVDSSKWNPDGTTHHFYVFTTGDDILLNATADIGDSTYNNFVLSHICHGPEQQESASEAQSVAESASVAESVAESASVAESVAESASVAESVPASAEQSVEASAASVAASASGEQSVEAGTGTPAASTPNGALGSNGSSPLPTIAFSLILLASLGTLAYANVKTVRSRI